MHYKSKNYGHLIGMSGFSTELLQHHFALYHSYVDHANELPEALSTIDKNPEIPEFAELKRRLGWEFNGMRLHEYYFENLGGTEPLEASPLLYAMEQEFGGLSSWEADFRGTAALRGIGWAILYRDTTGELINTWIDQHDTGHLVGCSPILVLDVFEHAYLLDYGLKRKDYITAFMKNVDWKIVSGRYNAAQQSKSTEALVRLTS